MLDVRGIDVAYGGIRAVRQLNLHVHPGELVALIGANGAGKSTTLRAICGLVPLAAGSIHYQGQSLAGQPVHSMVRQGLVMVPEGRGIFPQLTIEENLYMGAYTRTDKDGVAQDLEGVFTRFPRLAERRKQTAGTLSGGEQQMLAMGRAILSQPKLLLLDEPTMGLAPIMVDKIFEVIADISQRGVTILLIEQNARLALEVSQRGYVLESGELTLQGPAHDLLHDPKVRAAYLGE
ncbi:amino acid ABC transporter ATPase [Comamonas aquatica DA1877]|uniref:Amino acid ABC transporter ATPase n=1 Tax=Comamonas aquatica DA1877 TaxID=1457173 RepID=A0A014NXN9_9BURK|nr:amino acid ABC transporter ATPase [Comamonas aquatica DA1877]